jgi:hypothetical protein
MLRYSTFYKLANNAQDTRAIFLEGLGPYECFALTATG